MTVLFKKEIKKYKRPFTLPKGWRAIVKEEDDEKHD
jgi:hypothetical protein